MEGVASSAQKCYYGLREEKSKACGCRPITTLGLTLPRGIRGLCGQVLGKPKPWPPTLFFHPLRLCCFKVLYCNEGLEGLVWIAEGRPGAGPNVKNWWFLFLFLFSERAEIRCVFLGVGVGALIGAERRY